jgi:hypothetical protein
VVVVMSGGANDVDDRVDLFILWSVVWEKKKKKKRKSRGVASSRGIEKSWKLAQGGALIIVATATATATATHNSEEGVGSRGSSMDSGRDWQRRGLWKVIWRATDVCLDLSVVPTYYYENKDG